MMDYTTFWVIFTILFWVVVAMGVVCALICTFIYYEEFRWKKAERDYDNLVAKVNEVVFDIIDQINANNSGGNEQE